MGNEGGCGVECAECESQSAEIVCCTESLAYCNPCSQKIHSKKARSHHTILPIPPCSHCLVLPATLQCSQCKKSSKPKFAVLCRPCSNSIHSAPFAKVHTVTSLTIFNNILKTETNMGLDRAVPEGINHKQTPKKQVKTDEFEGGDVCNKGKKRKRMGNCDSEPPKKCPLGKRPKINVKEEHKLLIFPKEEKLTPPLSLPRRNTPRAAARRVFGPIEIHDTSSESDADEDSDLCYSDFEEETGIRRIQRGNITFEAFVVNAEGEDDGGDVGGGRSAGIGKEESIVVGIKKRIRKMLELGLHPETPDIEAQQALKNAQRLLTKHNLQQAEVMKGALKDSDALAGGMRVVELRSKGKSERIGRIEQWVIGLAYVIAENFDTQYFTRRYKENRALQVIFYGIKQNADCSGYAFAATFNRITIMSANYNPSKTSTDKENEEPAAQNTYTRIARNNYRLGIVAGLQEVVKKSSERYGDETASGRKHKGKRRAIQDKQKEAMQALVLHSKEVGEAYIKEKGIKIKKLGSLKESAWNPEAFTRGKIDSKQIDINQKALPTSHREKASKKL